MIFNRHKINRETERCAKKNEQKKSSQSQKIKIPICIQWIDIYSLSAILHCSGRVLRYRNINNMYCVLCHTQKTLFMIYVMSSMFLFYFFLLAQPKLAINRNIWNPIFSFCVQIIICLNNRRSAIPHKWWILISWIQCKI